MTLLCFRRLTFFALLLLLSACGYHNPNVPVAGEEGPPIALYVPYWSNPTSEIRLAPEIHNALHDWFLQIRRISLVDDPAAAGYTLNGKVLSVHYPGRAYDVKDTALEVKAILTVEYSLSEAASGKVIWQSGQLAFEESYAIDGSQSQVEARKKLAINAILDRLAEQVHRRITRVLIRKRN